MRPGLHNTLIALALFALIALGATACTAPRVHLQQAALGRLTTTGFQVNMDLQIFNPNTYTLPLRRVTWALDLFNANFTKGGVALNRNVNPGRRATVRVPLGIRFEQAAVGVQRFLSGRNIPWAINGRCDFQTAIGPVFVRFNNKGTWRSPLRGEAPEKSQKTIEIQLAGVY